HLLSPRVMEASLASGVTTKFKWPERLEWVSAFPQTNVGKINKKQLRADVIDKLESEQSPG
ncbi:(2,3-dihydroxybenzoyl)adenylate synthase, partial [Nocardia sp. NPDC060220]